MRCRIVALVGMLGMALAAPALPRTLAGQVLHISSHLAKDAQVSVDGLPAVVAPGYGSVNVPTAAGVHTLTVTSAGGVAYTGSLTLKPAAMMRWRDRGFWCVNLLKDAVEPYSKDECEEEVEDAG